MAKYRNLVVWQKADELAFQIYKLTEGFPASEKYGLTSQIRRAALSIPTNIVEGYGRKSQKELSRFLDISLGSLAELEYLLDFSKRLNYIRQDSMEIAGLLEEVGRLLWAFQKSVNGE